MIIIGLEGKIDFGEEYCRVQKPTYCWPDIFDGLMNYSDDSCDIKNRVEEKRKLIEKWKVDEKV